MKKHYCELCGEQDPEKFTGQNKNYCGECRSKLGRETRFREYAQGHADQKLFNTYWRRVVSE
jgi:hypothetical protein